MSCRVQCQSPSFETIAVAFAHGEEIVGLNSVDELVQLSRQVVSHAFGCNMLPVYKFN